MVQRGMELKFAGQPDIKLSLAPADRATGPEPRGTRRPALAKPLMLFGKSADEHSQLAPGASGLTSAAARTGAVLCST